MARLIALSPFAGLLPLDIGQCALRETVLGPLHLIAPLRGQAAAVATCLRAQTGVGLPAVGQRLCAGDAWVQWCGHGVWLCNRTVDLGDRAAVTDVSGGWAGAHIGGADVLAVLARRVPIDLRAPAFAPDAAARTLCGQIPVAISGQADAGFDLLVTRSLAAALVQDLSAAMASVAARAISRQ